MKNINVLMFSMEEFRELCDRIFNEEAWIENQSGEWFWVMTENIGDDDVKEKLELEFGREISGFRLDKIYVDLTEDVVIVAYK